MIVSITSVSMLSVIMLIVSMLSVFMQGVIRLNVVKLRMVCLAKFCLVIMLCHSAQCRYTESSSGQKCFIKMILGRVFNEKFHIIVDGSRTGQKDWSQARFFFFFLK